MCKIKNYLQKIIRTSEESAAGEPIPFRLRATPDAISLMANKK
ncbi:hypothetical protein [Bartonella sp. MU70NMGDW]